MLLIIYPIKLPTVLLLISKHTFNFYWLVKTPTIGNFKQGILKIKDFLNEKNWILYFKK
jgi:hypothetical protein